MITAEKNPHILGMALNLIRLRDVYNISMEDMLRGDFRRQKSLRPLKQDECLLIRRVYSKKHHRI